MEPKLVVDNEEREHLAQLVKSRGWLVVMRQMLIPLLMQTNARLDAVGTPEPHTQFHRGVKHTIKHLVEKLYDTAQLPNPLQEHQQAFLLTLSLNAQMEPTTEDNDKVPPFVPERRSSFPV